MPRITEHGYPVAEASRRLGLSQHSPYAWKQRPAKAVPGDAGKDASDYIKMFHNPVRKQVPNGMLPPVQFRF